MLFFENGAAAFEASKNGHGSGKRSEDAAALRIVALQDKLRRKDEVLSELMEEHMALKKSLGEV